MEAAAAGGSVTPLRVILDEQLVNDFVRERGLEYGAERLEAVLMQLHGTSRGMPCAMLVFEVEGKPVMVKTTLRNFLIAAKSLETCAEMHLGKNWQGLVP